MSRIHVEVHISRLPEWLQRRGICPKGSNWKDQLDRLKPRVEQSLKSASLLDNEKVNALVKAITDSEDIDFFDLEKLLKELKNINQDEANANCLSYIQELDSILREYKKKNAHIAEAADILFRGLFVRLPALDKDCNRTSLKLKGIEKLHAAIKDAQKSTSNSLTSQLTQLNIERIEELDTLASKFASDFQNACNSLGEDAASLKFAFYYHQLFTKAIHKRTIDDKANGPLETLICKGNITLFEYDNGYPPVKNDIEVGSSELTQIKSGDSNGKMEPGKTINNDEEAVEMTIDWGDDCESDLVTDESQLSSDSMTILENAETRELILQELCQLLAFFRQRVLSDKDDFDLITDDIIHENVDLFPPSSEVQRMYEEVHTFNESICGPHFTQLCAIRNCPRKLQFQCNAIRKKQEELKSLRQEEAVLTEQARILSCDLLRIKENTNRMRRKLRNLNDQLCKTIEETSSEQINFSIAGCGALMKAF